MASIVWLPENACEVTSATTIGTSLSKTIASSILVQCVKVDVVISVTITLYVPPWAGIML